MSTGSDSAMTSGREAKEASTESAGGQVSQPWLVNSSSTVLGAGNDGLMPGSCAEIRAEGTSRATIKARRDASRMRANYLERRRRTID